MSTDTQSVAARLNSSGFIRSQGFIGGKWTDAYDGKTIEVSQLCVDNGRGEIHIRLVNQFSCKQ